MRNTETDLINFMVNRNLVYLALKDVSGTKTTITKNLKHGSYVIKTEESKSTFYEDERSG